MVTRAFGTGPGQVNIRQTNQELTGLLSTVRSGVLPVLGLTAAFSILGGGLNDATASGRAYSGTMYQMQVSTYGLQEAVTRALLPGIEAVTPILAGIADRISDADEATDGWSTRLGIAGGAAFLLRNRIIGLGRAAVPIARELAYWGLLGAAHATVGVTRMVARGGAGPNFIQGIEETPYFGPIGARPPTPPRPAAAGERVPTAVPRPVERVPTVIHNNITIQTHDVDNGLRRAQEWIDNGALRLEPNP